MASSTLFTLAVVEVMLPIFFDTFSNQPVQAIGWDLDEYKQLHIETSKGLWELKKVTDMHHGTNHPEYDYDITTTLCGNVYVRGRCIETPTSCPLVTASLLDMEWIIIKPLLL